MNTHVTHRPAQAEMTLNRHCPLVTCGQVVKRGERIATSNVLNKGDIHSPFSGTIVHVDAYRIRITPEGNETVEPTSLKGLIGNDLRQTLLELGADLPEGCNLEHLIINAVDAEPGVISRQSLLNDYRETLETGAALLIALYAPTTQTLALLKDSSQGFSSLPQVSISNQYPAGLDPLVVKSVTGNEMPDGTLIIGLETLFHVGRIIETGLPVMETMVTIGKTSKIIPLGTPVGEIIREAGETLRNHDRIVLGGHLRGTAAASPQQGVDRATTAVAIVSNPAPVARDAACVGCGECIRCCPARLDPAMITSYAEFGMYDKAALEHVTACFECGLCGYFCIARRPMLQYIRLAKNELALSKAQPGEEL